MPTDTQWCLVRRNHKFKHFSYLLFRTFIICILVLLFSVMLVVSDVAQCWRVPFCMQIPAASSWLCWSKTAASCERTLWRARCLFLLYLVCAVKTNHRTVCKLMCPYIKPVLSDPHHHDIRSVYENTSRTQVTQDTMTLIHISNTTANDVVVLTDLICRLFYYQRTSRFQNIIRFK